MTKSGLKLGMMVMVALFTYPVFGNQKGEDELTLVCNQVAAHHDVKENKDKEKVNTSRREGFGQNNIKATVKKKRRTYRNPFI